MGTNKSEVEKMLASYGLMNNGVNNRKIQRMAKKQASNPPRNGHTQASVNARQQALKAKYEKRKLEKEKKEKENNQQNQSKQNQSKQNQSKQNNNKQQSKKK